MTEPEAAGTQPAPTVTPHPGISLLRQVIPGLDPEKVTPAVTELIKEMNPGGGKINTNVVQGENGSWLVGHDAKGNVVNKTDLGLGIPEGRNAQIQIAKQALDSEYKTGRFAYPVDSPEGKIELNRRVEKMNIAPPGADLIRQREMPGGAPSAAGAPAGQAPGQGPVSYRNAAPMSEATRERWAAGMYAVNSMGKLADSIEQLAPDTQARMSLFWRAAAQGTPGLNVFQFVSPTEQAEITKLRHVQIRYEQMMGGIRGAGSPYMMEIYKEMMGNIGAGQEPTVLRSLSQSIYDYMQHFADTEKSQGATRPLPQPTPPGQVVAPVAPKTNEAPWTDLGNGVRIREKR